MVSSCSASGSEEIPVGSLDSTWPQITGMMIPLYPILTNGKTEPPVTALANDGLPRSNIDRVGIQPSLLTMPIGHFHELALP
jgi:hypothetical protein